MEINKGCGSLFNYHPHHPKIELFDIRRKTEASDVEIWSFSWVGKIVHAINIVSIVEIHALKNIQKWTRKVGFWRRYVDYSITDKKICRKPCLLENPKKEISVSEGVGHFSATTHTLLGSSIIIVRDSTLQKVSI